MAAARIECGCQILEVSESVYSQRSSLNTRGDERLSIVDMLDIGYPAGPFAFVYLATVTPNYV